MAEEKNSNSGFGIKEIAGLASVFVLVVSGLVQLNSRFDDIKYNGLVRDTAIYNRFDRQAAVNEKQAEINRGVSDAQRKTDSMLKIVIDKMPYKPEYINHNFNQK